MRLNSKEFQIENIRILMKRVLFTRLIIGLALPTLTDRTGRVGGTMFTIKVIKLLIFLSSNSTANIILERTRTIDKHKNAVD